MEAVFRALSDPSRRQLLDLLFARDGQTLQELVLVFASQRRASSLEPMSRFGVMKHLKLLEQAGLVITRRVGREKYHYLNPVPIHELQRRWIDKFAEPWVSALAGLKQHLEEESAVMTKEAAQTGPAAHVQRIFIRAEAAAIWRAITTSTQTEDYFGDCSVESDWELGGEVLYRPPSGEVVVSGTILALEPERLLQMTWREHEAEMADDPPSRVSWEIEPVGEGVCRLTMVHDDFARETETYRSVGAGWPAVLSGLKTLLETGGRLEIPHEAQVPQGRARGVA